MDAFQLFACSGPWAHRVIMEAQIYGETLALTSWAIVALSIALAWMRSFAFVSTATMLTMATIHPGMWMSAVHGDCGDSLRACSLLWTILVVAVGIGVVVHSWRKGWGHAIEESPEP